MKEENIFNFEINCDGGWIVPDGFEFEANCCIPDFSELGNGCKLGNGCELGNWCHLGNDCVLGNVCVLGNGCVLGRGCDLGNECVLGYWCVLGNGCHLGNDCKLGNKCVLGRGCKLGNRCKLGNGCDLGNDCEIEGQNCIYFMTASNIDGTGRSINFIYNGEDVMIRAGCFFGSTDEMVKKAGNEGKEMYCAVVTAISEAILSKFKGL